MKDDPSDQTAYTALSELYAETQAWDELVALLEEHLPHATSAEDARAIRVRLAEVSEARGDRARATTNASASAARLTSGRVRKSRRLQTIESRSSIPIRHFR